MSCHHGNPNQRHPSCFPSTSPKPECATPPTVRNSLMILHCSFQRWSLGWKDCSEPRSQIPTHLVPPSPHTSLPCSFHYTDGKGETLPALISGIQQINHLIFYHDLIHVYKLHFFFIAETEM